MEDNMAAYTTIDDPSAHFQATAYAGTDASTLEVTNGGNSDLQPDLIWIKNRSDTDNHRLFNSTTSTGGNGLSLNSDGTAAEASNSAGGYMNGFNTDGFDLTDGASNGDIVKNNGENYIAWQWKANGGTRTTNTESGNNPAGGYQANTTAGFSIVDYVGTGAAGTMAHGLGVAPKFIIVKSRDDAYSWYVMHNGGASMDATDKLNLEDETAKVDNPQYWNDTAPTSTVFTLGDGNGTNKNDSNFLAYVFAPIQGYSKFGSYTGNGNADGPFVYTGFKPAFILHKQSSSTQEWQIRDNKRDTYNEDSDTILHADLTNADTTSTTNVLDFLSNGFKAIGTGAGTNQDGENYIYAAFAEQPFVTSGGVPCTAR